MARIITRVAPIWSKVFRGKYKLIDGCKCDKCGAHVFELSATETILIDTYCTTVKVSKEPYEAVCSRCGSIPNLQGEPFFPDEEIKPDKPPVETGPDSDWGYQEHDTSGNDCSTCVNCIYPTDYRRVWLSGGRFCSCDPSGVTQALPNSHFRPTETLSSSCGGYQERC